MAKAIWIIVFIVVAIGLFLFLLNGVKQSGVVNFVPFNGGITLVPRGSTGSGARSAPAPSYVAPQPRTQIVQPPTVSATTSPYYGKIRISSVSPYAYWPNSTQIYLSANLQSGQEVDITGWKLQSNRREFLIPQAVNVYYPTGLTPESDITLSGSNYVIIYSSASPISRNLRLNKCIGYLNNLYTFNPQLPNSCPTISRSQYDYLQGTCQNFISSIGPCQTPSPTAANMQSNECRAFIQNMNYTGCYNAHRSDADFLSNEWRVWANYNILDSNHDDIRLYDRSGKLVDEYVY